MTPGCVSRVQVHSLVGAGSWPLEADILHALVFQALQHRNFRLLWVGLLVSFSGSYMQTAALLWHVSLLVPDDRSALALGMVGLVRVVPIVVFSLISGVAADALDRRKLMLLTQSSMAVLAASCSLVTYRGLTAVWPIYVLAAASSAAGAFDLPARQSLVPTLVPREHLPNAISLNTIMFQIASVVGPALGGLVIADRRASAGPTRATRSRSSS